VKNILLPTDFSDVSLNAIQYAMHMFAHEDVEFTLLHAFQVPYSTEGSVIFSHDSLKEEAMAELNRVKDTMQKMDSSATIKRKVLMGSLSNVLARLVKNDAIDLIIMGTRGASGMREVFFGSNTADVIRMIDCPTLAIPEGALLKDLKRMMLAVDYGELDLKVLAPMVELARKNGSEIMVLNIILETQEPNPNLEQEKASLAAHLDGLDVTFHTIVNSKITEDIDAFSQKEQVDMVITIPRHKGFLNALFHKSVSRKLALHGKIPLLAIPDIS
jgi:nucleotide-binding universal stress UspA family protein